MLLQAHVLRLGMLDSRNPRQSSAGCSGLGCNHNQLSGTVPYMPSLQVLDVSSNLLTEPRFDDVPATLQLL